MVACSGPLGKLGSDGFPMVLERWHWVVQADHAPAGGRQGVKARPLSLTQGMLGGRTSSQGPLETTGPGCAPRSRQDGRGQGGRSSWPLRQADAEEVQQGPGEGRQPGLTRGPGLG